MILVLTEPGDAHLPYVIKHLRAEDCVVIDVTTLAQGNALHFDIQNGQVGTFYNKRQLENVTGVWIRRPTHIHDVELPVEDRYIAYVRSALLKTYEQLYSLFPDAIWMSDRYALRRANNKVLQLQAAAKVGLKTPKTILSSDAELTSEFIKLHPHAIMKPVATTYPSAADDVPQLFFTTTLDPEKPLDLSGMYLGPTFFQERIKPTRELRVTVVGNQVFAATMTMEKQEENPQVRDWRYGYLEGAVHASACGIPDHLAEACIALTKELNLSYGAIDFIEDEDGAIWFLEINPNGQWAFVESETGQPIGKAIADLLSGRA